MTTAQKTEILSRIAQTTAVLAKLNTLPDVFFGSTFLKAYETWTLTAELKQRIQVLRLKNFFHNHGNSAEHEIFSDNKYENANYCWHFHIY